MNQVRVMTTTGQQVEIPPEELERLIHSHHTTGQTTSETNAHYKSRAFHNICEAAKYHGIRHVSETEDEMKDLMIFALRHEDPEMLGELIEWFIADHAEKTGK